MAVFILLTRRLQNGEKAGRSLGDLFSLKSLAQLVALQVNNMPLSIVAIETLLSHSTGKA